MTRSTLREMSEFELGWVVGFLEGEGSFLCHVRHKPNRTEERALEVRASQVQREPLDRLTQYTGIGKISGPHPRHRPNQNPIYNWGTYGLNGLGLIRVLRPFLSPKRQVQVDKAIALYESRQFHGWRNKVAAQFRVIQGAK